MTLAVFGATGPAGLALVKRALLDSHSVRALVRNQAKLGDFRGRVEIVEGSISDHDRVSRTISGSDAVISVAGPDFSGGQEMVGIFVAGLRSILSAMEAHRVRRFIVVSGLSLPLPGTRRGFLLRLASFIMKRLLPHVFETKVAEFDVLRQSTLDWTVVRPAMLQFSRRPSGGIRVHESRIPGTRLAADDLAVFLLEQLTDRTWIHKAPLVSSR